LSPVSFFICLPHGTGQSTNNKIGGHDLTAKYQRFLPSWVKAQPLVVDQVGAAYPLDMRRAIALIYV
jgi:hypothetical protein